MAFSNAENERQLLEYKMTMNEHSGMIDLSGGVIITLGSAKKYLDFDLPSRITT